MILITKLLLGRFQGLLGMACQMVSSHGRRSKEWVAAWWFWGFSELRRGDDLANFGLRESGVFNRSEFVEHVCMKWRRSFRDETVDVKAWIVSSLDEAVKPDAEIIWDKRVKRTAMVRAIDAQARI